ncbi:MAG: lamin tail domain-containing protein [bacterium]|nr:lamin tail domain-containing protein [bacterium]
MILIIIFLPLFFLSGEVMAANPFLPDNPSGDTAAVKLETRRPASGCPELETSLLITEVSFKNPKNCQTCGWGDWIEIYCSGKAGTELDLSGYRIQAGWEHVKTITPGTKIKPEEYLVLHRGFFLDEKRATHGVLDLFNPDLKLVETDSQVILYDREGRICDAVCWTDQDATWTAANIERIISLSESGEWIMSLDKADQVDCFQSGLLKPGMSLVRKKGLVDTQTKDDWEIDSTPTMGRNNGEEPIPVKIKDPKVSKDPFYIDGSDLERAVTEVVFYLNVPAKVNLQIYDRDGNVRKTLLKDQFLFAGESRIVWDGTDKKGNPVSMGSYICHLKVKEPISSTEDEVIISVVAAVKVKRNNQ